MSHTTYAESKMFRDLPSEENREGFYRSLSFGTGAEDIV